MCLVIFIGFSQFYFHFPVFVIYGMEVYDEAFAAAAEFLCLVGDAGISGRVAQGDIEADVGACSHSIYASDVHIEGAGGDTHGWYDDLAAFDFQGITEVVEGDIGHISAAEDELTDVFQRFEVYECCLPEVESEGAVEGVFDEGAIVEDVAAEVDVGGEDTFEVLGR